MKLKKFILYQKVAQKNENPQQFSTLKMKASKYQIQSKLRKQNLNQTQNPGRKQSQRCQTEGH
jgi:hypothetical protein